MQILVTGSNGFIAKNLRVRLKESNYNILEFKRGDSLQLLEQKIIKSNDYIVYGSMGAEYGWKQMYFLRAGSHLNHDTAGLSLGAGANIRLGRMMLTVDYAYVDYDLLNSTNQFAISLKF